jgi:hypothetical protein
VFVFICTDCASFALHGNAKMIKDGDPVSPIDFAANEARPWSS